MGKIIEQLTFIADGDPWKMRDNLRRYIEVLKEKRDEAIKAKEEKPQDPINEDDSVNPRSPEQMLKDGQEAVKEFDAHD